MLIFYTLILAIVQGVTEFWPISSSGHLIILHDLFNVDIVNSLTFDVALHFGTLLAILSYFWRDILRYIKAFGRFFTGFNIGQEDQKTVLNIIVATIPTVIIGYFFNKYWETLFRSVWAVAIALVLGGILMLIVEARSRRKVLFESLALPEAFLIGVAQAIALIPGVSRSGATIVAGMALNLKREEAARFAFILSLPVVLAAFILKIIDLDRALLAPSDWYIMAFGIVVSAITGYFVIKTFLSYLQKRTLKVFAWYRIVIGLTALSVLYFIR
jgi:undecaprenyl-diphosphatase